MPLRTSVARNSNNTTAFGATCPARSFQFIDDTARRAKEAGLPDPQHGSYPEQAAATRAYIERFYPKAAEAKQKAELELRATAATVGKLEAEVGDKQAALEITGADKPAGKGGLSDLVTKVRDDDVLDGNACHGVCLVKVSVREEGVSTTGIGRTRSRFVP